MEKEIIIDINNLYELVEKYNDNKISHDMVRYVIKEAMLAKKYDHIKLVINKKCKINKNVIEMLKVGLKEEFERSLFQYQSNNKRQLFFLCLGFILIFLALLIKERTVIKEILLISGWVPIWEIMELELYPDVYSRKKRKVIDKLLNSEFEENELYIDGKVKFEND